MNSKLPLKAYFLLGILAILIFTISGIIMISASPSIEKQEIVLVKDIVRIAPPDSWKSSWDTIPRDLTRIS